MPDRLCACGCGSPPKKNIVRGRNKGWLKYAEGHCPPPPLCDPKVRAKAGRARSRKIPIGTRHIRTVYGKKYWVIKITLNQWMFEHRYLMEKKLKRRLLRSEHVHHRDDDGLNNGKHKDGKWNLQLMTHSEHSSHTSKKSKRPLCVCKCPHCGKKVAHFKKFRTNRRLMRSARSGTPIARSTRS
jgi:hypothetical protein